MESKDNSLVRYGFLKLLEKEFDIHIKERDLERIELAKRCIYVFDSQEEFYQFTGWARDNPETSKFSYLLENKICRVLAGKVWYFSQLDYLDGIKKLEQD